MVLSVELSGVRKHWPMGPLHLLLGLSVDSFILVDLSKNCNPEMAIREAKSPKMGSGIAPAVAGLMCSYHHGAAVASSQPP